MTQPRNSPDAGPPAPPMRRARRQLILIALLLGLVAVLAIGITLSSHSASPPAGGTAAAPREAAITRGARWLTGPAGQLLEAVNADVGRIRASQRAGRRDVTTMTGAHLATDAKAALSGPMPPADAKIYRSALEDFERAGTSAASGRFGNANNLLNAGDSDITKVTAAVNPPAAVNFPAAVNEPNGQ
jgi:hypothetical protein